MSLYVLANTGSNVASQVLNDFLHVIGERIILELRNFEPYNTASKVMNAIVFRFCDSI